MDLKLLKCILPYMFSIYFSILVQSDSLSTLRGMPAQASLLHKYRLCHC